MRVFILFFGAGKTRKAKLTTSQLNQCWNVKTIRHSKCSKRWPQ